MVILATLVMRAMRYVKYVRVPVRVHVMQAARHAKHAISLVKAATHVLVVMVLV